HVQPDHRGAETLTEPEGVSCRRARVVRAVETNQDRLDHRRRLLITFACRSEALRRDRRTAEAGTDTATPPPLASSGKNRRCGTACGQVGAGEWGAAGAVGRTQAGGSTPRLRGA